MKFTPKTDEELSNVWNSDWYSGVIESAEEKLSQKNNEMLVLGVRVYDATGRDKKLDDYVVEAVAYKLKHLADAAGLSSDYEAGELNPSQLLNKEVGVKLKIQIDKNGEYPDKNTIADYRPLDAGKKSEQKMPTGVPVAKQNAAKKAAAEVGDDEIPFSFVGPLIGLLATIAASIA